MQRTLCVAATAIAAVVLIPLMSSAEEGQGPITGEVTIEGVNLGTYWYGAKISKDDLRGKVVLVEQWGS